MCVWVLRDLMVERFKFCAQVCGFSKVFVYRKQLLCTSAWVLLLFVSFFVLLCVLICAQVCGFSSSPDISS